MKKFIALLLCLLFVLSFAACGSNEEDPTEETQAEENVNIEIGDTTNKITTPYADIFVPEDFAGNVTYDVVKEDPYTLMFMAGEDDIVIFSLVFNGDGKGLTLVGTLIGEKGNTVVYMSFPEIDKKNKDYEALCKYQEETSYIIEQLSKNYEFKKNEIVESDYQETFDIKTDVVTLKYPVKWKDKVTVDVSEEGARFSADGTPLFDFLFGEKNADGDLIGTYNGTPVVIALYDLDKSKLKDAEYKELSTMQSDANVILDYLESDKNFKHK